MLCLQHSPWGGDYYQHGMLHMPLYTPVSYKMGITGPRPQRLQVYGDREL